MFFETLRAQGVTNLSEHFDKQPPDIDACIKRIKVLQVNNETLEMFGADSEQELLNDLDRIFRDEMRHHLRSELLTLWNSGTSWQGEGINHTLKGSPAQHPAALTHPADRRGRRQGYPPSPKKRRLKPTITVS